MVSAFVHKSWYPTLRVICGFLFRNYYFDPFWFLGTICANLIPTGEAISYSPKISFQVGQTCQVGKGPSYSKPFFPCKSLRYAQGTCSPGWMSCITISGVYSPSLTSPWQLVEGHSNIDSWGSGSLSTTTRRIIQSITTGYPNCVCVTWGGQPGPGLAASQGAHLSVASCEVVDLSIGRRVKVTRQLSKGSQAQ